ncbi:MAG: hypothetical protein ACXWZF_11685 [Actinomycetota bacterium]
MTTTDQRRPQRWALELQARARDHALADRVDRSERVIARVHARIDGAMVTLVPAAHARGNAGSPSA